MKSIHFVFAYYKFLENIIFFISIYLLINLIKSSIKELHELRKFLIKFLLNELMFFNDFLLLLNFEEDENDKCRDLKGKIDLSPMMINKIDQSVD